MATSGVYALSSGLDVYCDQKSAGGGWTMVVAQFEQSPVTWDGAMAQYDPTLAGRTGFSLPQGSIPTHSETGFGKDLLATGVGYANFAYSTGNIPVTTVTNKKTGKTFQIHRDTGRYFSAGNPEPGEGSGTSPAWLNHLTFDESGGRKYSWCFAPLNPVPSYRGYNYGRTWDYLATESFAWTVWVR